MANERYDLEVLMERLIEADSGDSSTFAGARRMVTLALDYLGCATATQAFDMLYADWRGLPEASAIQGMRAGQILVLLPTLRFGGLGHTGKEAGLLRAAREYGLADEQWQRAVFMVGSLAGFGVGSDDLAGMERASTSLAQVRASVPMDAEEARVFDLADVEIRLRMSQIGGGADEIATALHDMERMRQEFPVGTEIRSVLEIEIATFKGNQAVRARDETALAEQIGRLAAELSGLPADHRERVAAESNLEFLELSLSDFRGRSTGQPFPPDSTRSTVQEVRAQVAQLPVEERAAALGAVGILRASRASAVGDADALREAMRLLEDAMEPLAPDDGLRLRCASTLGMAHASLGYMAAAEGRDPLPHVDRGISLLRDSWERMGGPAHPLWGNTGAGLAEAYRMRGDVLGWDGHAGRRDHAEARRVGLDASRAAAWDALLQSGTADAAEAGRRGSAKAVELARWCLADGALEDALPALDSARALVLHAATVAVSVPDMLDDVKAPGLADRWRQAATSAPAPAPGADPLGPSTGPTSRLRREVLGALTDSPYERRLFHVPCADDIGEALRNMERTALAYLLPGVGGEAGAAVIVTVDGRTGSMPLPGLHVDAAELGGEGTGGGLRRDIWGRLAGGPPGADATPADTPPAAQSVHGVDAEELDRLCEWAGREVMAPLLDAVTRFGGREPSLVLVPMGMLGAVPWHAARLPSGRYACQEAEVSYMPSARLLCEVAGRRPTGVRRAVVVGDPTGDLEHAGAEARAIHRAFYPEGTLLGTATATPATVAGRVARQGGGVLHLACHGTVEAGRRHSSYLELSGGRLPAEELTEGASRLRDLELVVLAACRTNVSGHGYDEAYSLSTAFLVAGARSVVGSLWPVPDDATSLLMYMTHHYLNREELTPGAALRRAQLWMLDPGRQAPPGMPKEMVARVGRIKADDLIGWAGFTHLGW
ncbi:CHAT domain-containing protein [Streptomyces zhihengii]